MQNKLVNLSKEEGEKVVEEIEAVLNKYSAQFVVLPVINLNGTLAAKLEIFKKEVVNESTIEKSEDTKAD